MATQPATLDELRGLVAEARRVSPLTVPDGTATKLAAANVTVAQAQSRLFQLITGERSSVSSADGDGILAASMRRQLARAGHDEGSASHGGRSPDARTSMALELMKTGIDPKDAA